MLPKSLNEWIGYILTFGAGIFAFLKVAKWYFDTEVDKSKSKDNVEVAKHNADTAKHSAEILTASQVVELMKATSEVKEDILQIKAENKDRNEQLSKAMDKLENNLKDFENLFQQYLVKRVSQFEQTLIK